MKISIPSVLTSARIALLFPSAVLASDSETALSALKLLPRGQAKNVARIEARDGTPAPERWHILVYDKGFESGVHEYVIAAGEIVASRNISQFAETLTTEDVLESDALRVDSDRAARLIQQYALANNLSLAALNYELKKDGADADPLWHVTGLDEAGKEIGAVVLTASKGVVISHPGFEVEPKWAGGKKDGFRSQADGQLPSWEVVPDDLRPGPRNDPRELRDRKPSLFRRAGGSLQKFFTGRDTISR